MSALIEARGLVKRYGARTVVRRVDLTVAPGEIVAVVGPNGAGKTTTLEMILGIRRPDGGRVTCRLGDPRRETGAQLQATPFFPHLTAAENLQLFAAFYGVRLSPARVAELLEGCGLAGAARTEAARLSGGQQKRLAIALALVHRPKVLFLDEPAAALDPRARREVRELIRRVAMEGTAVVFTSHDLEEVGKLAHRVVFIIDGEVRAAGSPAELLARHGAPTLEDLYLRLTEGQEV